VGGTVLVPLPPSVVVIILPHGQVRRVRVHFLPPPRQ